MPKRRQILASVVEVFAERGYERTSVEDLVDATGLDIGSFLVHFADKGECFLASYEFILASARARVQASLTNDDPWPQRLAAGLAAIFALIDEEPVAARFVFDASCVGPPAISGRTLVETVGLKTFMGEGRTFADHGYPLPEVLDSALPGGVAFVIHRRLSATPPDPVAPLYEEMLQVLLLPYLGKAVTAEFMTSDARRSDHLS